MPDESVKKPAVAETNVKETVESILIAFILAFIFRGFVVEAFVIPTGSMAPTLYGAHMRFRCPDCGTSFDVGYSSHDDSDDPEYPAIAERPIDYHCPNCGYTFRAGQMQRVRFGDRILVLKYLYLFQKPQRGDTVVFKSPYEGRKHKPSDPDYSVNYIKRLTGIGPETVVILDGDIYVGPFGSRDPKQFKIWRKPDHVQNVLWRTINDNDYIPHLSDAQRASADPWQQPWEAGKGQAGWDLGKDGRSSIFRFNGTAAATLEFRPELNRDAHNMTDYHVYDELEQHNAERFPVSDLKLGCTYSRAGGTGPLLLQLTKHSECFTAEITPGNVRLLRSSASALNFDAAAAQVVGAKAIGALGGSAPVRIELSNVDYRVTLRIDGRDELTFDYDPDVAVLWENENERRNRLSHPHVRMMAAGQQCAIEHVQVARDIFYQNNDGRLQWGIPRQPVDLKAGEYFVLGDNSPISGDARFWTDPIKLEKEGMPDVESGRVPEQFMLGKAFFVYWPAGYPVPSTNINIVPDFGDMRFIH
ncbi:MAG TPA: S26 family signal peptidase [Humisphaera sp.]|jgi:signal peptidase I|nr:S26 family signal peptidase [Humisphaera sp.]